MQSAARRIVQNFAMVLSLKNKSKYFTHVIDQMVNTCNPLVSKFDAVLSNCQVTECKACKSTVSMICIYMPRPRAMTNLSHLFLK